MYPVADVNRDGIVNSTDQSDWYNFYSGGSSHAVAVAVDLNADELFPDSEDDDLFTESYNANSGLSGKGHLCGGSGASATMNRKGYAGYEWDPVVEVFHVRHRVYFPTLGRWSRRDPLGYVDPALSLYAYVSSMALRYRDPMGLDADDDDPFIMPPFDPARLKYQPPGIFDDPDEEPEPPFKDLIKDLPRIFPDTEEPIRDVIDAACDWWPWGEKKALKWFQLEPRHRGPTGLKPPGHRTSDPRWPGDPKWQWPGEDEAPWYIPQPDGDLGITPEGEDEQDYLNIERVLVTASLEWKLSEENGFDGFGRQKTTIRFYVEGALDGTWKLGVDVTILHF